MSNENDTQEPLGRDLPSESSPSSPLHPVRPDVPAPQRRLRPTPPRRPRTDFLIEPDPQEDSPESTTPSEPPVTLDQRERAEEALLRLREKMAQVANEFAAGKINRAQFNAIYSRYNEQRQITERLLERNPDSVAWRQVVQEGHTAFLRQHYQSRVLSYALYDNESSMPVYSLGSFKIEASLLVPMLSSFRAAASEMFGAGLKSTEIEGGRWLVFVPGHFTTSIVLFSLEPSPHQLDLVQDLHRDFENANRQALERGSRSQDRLVFPQRALFERKT